MKTKNMIFLIAIVAITSLLLNGCERKPLSENNITPDSIDSRKVIINAESKVSWVKVDKKSDNDSMIVLEDTDSDGLTDITELKISRIETDPKTSSGYMIVLGDTTGDGLPDINVRINNQDLIKDILYTKTFFQPADITLPPGKIIFKGPKKNSNWIYIPN